MDTQEFDYLIVGAGSAGCVLASRLTENPAVSVCLLEAGASDSSVFIHAPAGAAVMLPIPYNNWAFKTVPQKGLNGRRGYQPRGKVVGGSSSTMPCCTCVDIAGTTTIGRAWAMPAGPMTKSCPTSSARKFGAARRGRLSRRRWAA
ncbi:MAG: lycopene cyclase family protein [Rhodospirillales bacterium]